MPAGLAWVLAGLCAAGAAGNGLLLAVLAWEARRGRGAPWGGWLLNVCSADLALALLCLPARVAGHWRRARPAGGLVCRAGAWLLHACLVAKSLSWAAAGRARLHHLRTPAKGRGWSRARLAAGLAATWATALLLPLPVLLFTRPEGAPAGQPPSCDLRPPAAAANFMEVFSKVYPLAAFLAPAAFTGACYARALRLHRERQKRPAEAKGGAESPAAPRLLCGLSLLFHATWLPEWLVWLWERHGTPGGAPPRALLFLAEVLLFLNAACNPAVFGAASQDFRQGLASLWTALRCGRGKEAAAGETPQALRALEADAAPEKVLPDVEHFWKDRRDTGGGEESDPVPWEHQGDP